MKRFLIKVRNFWDSILPDKSSPDCEGDHWTPEEVKAHNEKFREENLFFEDFLTVDVLKKVGWTNIIGAVVSPIAVAGIFYLIMQHGGI